MKPYVLLKGAGGVRIAFLVFLGSRKTKVEAKVCFGFDLMSALSIRILNVSHAATHVSLHPVTCKTQRMLFGCNKDFVVQHKEYLERIFVKKRYQKPAILYAI